MELNYLVAKLSVPFSREVEKCIKSPKKLSLACFLLYVATNLVTSRPQQYLLLLVILNQSAQVQSI